MTPQIGRRYRSADHRNQNCPYIQVIGFTTAATGPWKGAQLILVQRFRDEAFTQPHGARVPTHLQWWTGPGAPQLIEAGGEK